MRLGLKFAVALSALALGACESNSGGSSSTAADTSTASTDNTGSTDSTDNTGSTDSTDSTDSTGSTDSTDSTDGTGGTDSTDGTDSTAGGPPFGSEADIAMANDLWSNKMANYDSWGAPANYESVVTSAAPHAQYARYYWNDAASADVNADGAIIVKDNVNDEAGSDLNAITVMYKVAGFNPDEADWFFAKFRPDGSLDENPNGVKLAGKVGKGGMAGCIPCHGGAGGDDFLFFND